MENKTKTPEQLSEAYANMAGTFETNQHWITMNNAF